MQYTQILNATSLQDSLLTFPFPYTFGQYGALRSWVQTGNSNPKVTRRSNFKQHWWAILGEVTENDTCNWHAQKCKLVADILLLYTNNTPYNRYLKLPQALCLNFNEATAADVYYFIAPTKSENPRGLHNDKPAWQRPHETIPLPIRYFNNIQKQLIIQHLLTLGESQTAVTSIVWSEPKLGTEAHDELQQANYNLSHLQLNYKLEKETKKQLAKTPEAIYAAHQEQFFRLYTAHEQGRDTDHKGWPNPTTLIEREKQILDPKYLTHPMTLERWAKWELAFTHWHNLQYLQHHYTLTFFPNELLKMASYVEEVTGTNPLQPTQTNPNPPHDQTTTETLGPIPSEPATP